MSFVKASTAFMKLYTYLRQLYHIFEIQGKSNQMSIYLTWQTNSLRWHCHPTFFLFLEKKKKIRCVKIHKCSAQEKKIRTQRDFVTLNLHEGFLGSVNLQNCNKSGHPSPEPPQSLTIILFLAQSLNAIVVICTTLQQLSVTRTWIMMKQKCSDPLSA